MYLSILVLPLLGSIVSGFLGRKIGVTGSHFITSTALIISSGLAAIAFYEVGICGSPVSIQFMSWIDSESMNVSWGLLFDSLTVSMLIPVLFVSTLVHIYSISYMAEDPAKCYGKTFIGCKLSNSGDTLKLMVPSYSRKAISG
jgi:NADH-ubiquinone oxidoreductase chain 5